MEFGGGDHAHTRVDVGQEDAQTLQRYTANRLGKLQRLRIPNNRYFYVPRKLPLDRKKIYRKNAETSLFHMKNGFSEHYYFSSYNSVKAMTRGVLWLLRICWTASSNSVRSWGSVTSKSPQKTPPAKMCFKVFNADKTSLQEKRIWIMSTELRIPNVLIRYKK